MTPLRPTPEQGRAADPAASVWVTANAGTGKTRVLVDRVLRLLLAGAEPATILCITFTRAAAAEMRGRVETRLAEWATARDAAALAGDLEALQGIVPDPGTLDRAARLFAQVLDLPGGLAIMTIHALSNLLLKRFPLEADVPPHFEVMDDRSATELLTDAREEVMAKLADDDESELAGAMNLLARELADLSLAEALDEAVSARLRLRDLMQDDETVAPMVRRIRHTLGIATDAREADLVGQACQESAFDRAGLAGAVTALRTGGKTDAKRAEQIKLWLSLDLPQRERGVEAYSRAFLTEAGEPAKSLMTKAVAEANPASLGCLLDEQDRLLDHKAALLPLRNADRIKALLTVASAVIGAYERRKRSGSMLDYDDLLERTVRLLRQPGKSAWVLYKLDARLAHVLVDEAQDTSPLQWALIEALTDEFFTGAGQSATPRTLFVVGDEKQSIFGFQGADVRRTAEVRARLTARARDAGMTFRDETLSRSFRSTSTVLGTVDAVFALPEARAGVAADGDIVRHDTQRIGEAGLVEVWPLFRSDARTEVDAWQPEPEPRAAEDAEQRIATRIADTIAGWLRTGERLAATGKPIRAGDIMILLSRRGRLQELLVRAFKEAAIPVQGADRFALTGHIAVMDLVALGKAMLLPEDDLNFACLLKSPLVGLGEDDLFTLAWNRDRYSLLERLREAAAAGREPFTAAYARVEGWLRRADFAPPYEFYAELLGAGGGRRRMLARLGPDAAEPIEAFLAQALAYERGHPASLEGFLHWLGLESGDLKRDPEGQRDEVRVLTVHGAKGLEAPIVFLADAGPQKNAAHGRLLWTEEDGLPLWRPRQQDQDLATAAECERRERRDIEERNRLFYVALTRARDRLYVCGRLPRRAHGDAEMEPGNSWLASVRKALEGKPELQRFPMDIGGGNVGEALRWQDGAAALAAPADVPLAEPTMALPVWATVAAASEPSPTRPLSPSSLGGGEPVSVAPGDKALRFAFGRHVHRLLQLLPDVPLSDRAAAIERYAARAAGELTPDLLAAMGAQVGAILVDPIFAPLFAPGSRAEQPLAGIVDGITVAGQVDRIAVTDTEVLLVDFKTGRPPPAGLADTPVAYLRQMAAYRRLLRAIFPGREVRAGLLWTAEPRLDLLPASLLEAQTLRPEAASVA